VAEWELDFSDSGFGQGPNPCADDNEILGFERS